MGPLAPLYIQGSDNKQKIFSGEYLRWELQEVNTHIDCLTITEDLRMSLLHTVLHS